MVTAAMAEAAESVEEEEIASGVDEMDAVAAAILLSAEADAGASPSPWGPPPRGQDTGGDGRCFRDLGAVECEIGDVERQRQKCLY